MPRILTEDEILNEKTRAEIIAEMIDGPENIRRKENELRKHEIYRDQNKKWVMAALAGEGFKPSTLKQMENRATNVSICRKIVNKLAQCYSGGVVREVIEDETSSEAIEELADILDIDSIMKKVDRYRQLFRNTQLLIVPKKAGYADEEQQEELYDFCMRVLAPWQYDAIEDPTDNTKTMVLMITDFPERDQLDIPLSGTDAIRASQGYRNIPSLTLSSGDGRNQRIADSPSDKGTDEDEREIIWWSKSYHFTTDVHGVIIQDKSPEGTKNPIGRIPACNVTGDQDGNFWAIGGDDVVDGSILINKLLTDMNFISFVQGWGQMVIAAKNIPNRLEGGPDNAFTFELMEGDPTPVVEFATSNPPIEKLLEAAKSQLALLLSSNNLSPRTVSANLDASNAASGIAILIDQSESMSDLQDVQKTFQDKEPDIWEIIRQWHELYSAQNAWVPEIQEIAPFESSEVTLKFQQLKPAVSEKEKLEAIKLRKELGLNTQAELLMMDNPDLTKEDADSKVEEIGQEKDEQQQKMMKNMVSMGAPPLAKPGIVDKGNGKAFPPKKPFMKGPPNVEK